VEIVGAELTVRTTRLEVMETQELVTTQEYAEESLESMLERVSVAVVAPEICPATSERSVDPFLHRKVGVGVPVAATLNTAVVPGHCASAVGWVVIASVLTKRRAESLRTEPHEVLTRHL
jgi:hypothetical protein